MLCRKPNQSDVYDMPVLLLTVSVHTILKNIFAFSFPSTPPNYDTPLSYLVSAAKATQSCLPGDKENADKIISSFGYLE